MKIEFVTSSGMDDTLRDLARSTHELMEKGYKMNTNSLRIHSHQGLLHWFCIFEMEVEEEQKK